MFKLHKSSKMTYFLIPDQTYVAKWLELIKSCQKRDDPISKWHLLNTKPALLLNCLLHRDLPFFKNELLVIRCSYVIILFLIFFSIDIKCVIAPFAVVSPGVQNLRYWKPDYQLFLTFIIVLMFLLYNECKQVIVIKYWQF